MYALSENLIHEQAPRYESICLIYTLSRVHQ